MPPRVEQFNLNRFVAAQDAVYETVLDELRHGRKVTHWMWFVFPQMAGLGQSEMARRYAIHSAEEARAYLAHPVLSARLKECIEILNGLHGLTAEDIFGPVDAMKLKSSLTLFAVITKDAEPFVSCLAHYYGGAYDGDTVHLLGL